MTTQPITYHATYVEDESRLNAGWFVYYVGKHGGPIIVTDDLLPTSDMALSFIKTQMEFYALYQDAVDVDTAQELLALPA